MTGVRALGPAALVGLLAAARLGATDAPAPAVPDVSGLARAVADSLRPNAVCAVAAADFGDGYARVDPTDPLPAALARALGVPLARRGAWPACARRAAAGDSTGTLAVVAGRCLAPGGREARVSVGLRVEGLPDAPRSGFASDWTYRAVRGRGGRWRVTGAVGGARVT